MFVKFKVNIGSVDIKDAHYMLGSEPVLDVDEGTMSVLRSWVNEGFIKILKEGTDRNGDDIVELGNVEPVVEAAVEVIEEPKVEVSEEPAEVVIPVEAPEEVAIIGATITPVGEPVLIEKKKYGTKGKKKSDD